MIHPQPTAMIATVIESIDKILRPGLEAKLAQAAPETVSQDKLRLSTVITMRHMLQFTLLRMQNDPAQHDEEILLLQPVFASLASFLAAQSDAEAKRVLSQVASAMERTSGALSRALSDEALAAEIGALRLVIQNALRWLTHNRASLKNQSGYDECRRLIREYVAWQLTRESERIDQAIEGQDFRR